MKKIFLFCAAVVAAMSINASITEMTCAEAAAAAALLDNKTQGTDSVAVTGFVTSTDGKISSGQQVFWMDDAQGSKKTFEGYWCNLPAEDVTEGKPLNVGDKVRVLGFLKRYNDTYEIQNGDVIILERAVVVIDTLEATVCEAIDECEALTSGDNTKDIFQVIGIVSSLGQTNDTYHTQTFYMDCEDNEKSLQAYNVTMDGDYANIGDTVFCEGRLKKYNTTLELIGDARVIGKAEVYIPDTISVTVAEAEEIALALGNNKNSMDIYKVTGYVDSIAIAYDEQYHNISFFMTDDINNPTYTFEAYRVKVNDWQAARIQVGVQVTVTAPLKHYYKAAVDETPELHLAETADGGSIEFVGFEGINNVSNNEQTIKRIENGQVVIIRNNVKYNALGVEVK